MMAVVSVDSSGHVRSPPIWFVAVRKKRKVQVHHCIFIDSNTHDKYIKFAKNWAEKLSAVLIFMVVEPIIHYNDVIEIDNDFQGRNKEKVRQYIHRIFGEKYFGSTLSKPSVEFLPKDNSVHVLDAHVKSKLARKGKIPRKRLPNLDNILNVIK